VLRHLKNLLEIIFIEFAFIVLNKLKIVRKNENIFRLKYPFAARSGLTSRPSPNAFAVMYSHYHYLYSWAL
jgi:hypothetical protein